MFEVIDIKPRIGSEVRMKREDFLAGTYAAEIEKLLVERSALVFRELHLTGEEQRQFARTIGTITDQGDDGLSKISMNPEVSSVAGYTRGAFYWHIDGANDPIPAKATMLSAQVLAEEGGDTLICNTYAAYADLPAAEKEALDGLRVRHALEASQRLVTPQPTVAELERWGQRPSQTHPLVWHHKSGHPSLLIGATAYYVEGMSREDSDMLLCRIQEWATQDRFVYRHKWTVGDFLLFDNTGGMHRADWYALDSDRLMHRCTLDGEEPVLN
jgi:alpha-ketoglutarate-dependent taurine dioxygenase